MRVFGISALVAVEVLVGGVHVASAADEKLLLPIQDALKAPEAVQKLDGSVKFYFGDVAHPKVAQDFGFTITHPKSAAYNRPKPAACNYIFLSGMLSLQHFAKSVGANAIVNIHSYYEQNDMSSETEFECHIGALLGGVTLRGDVVRIADQ